MTYATTEAFLEHFGLASLADLPGAAEMKAAGLLDLAPPADFEIPDPAQASDDDLEPVAEAGEAGAFHTDFLGEDAA
jgi:segregation and condensation protein B